MRPTLIPVLVLLAALLPRGTYAQTLSGLVEEVKPSIATVVAYDEEGSVLRTGTGFFIDGAGGLVTNLHVVNNAHHCGARTLDGSERDVLGMDSADPAADLVLLRVDVRAGSFPALSLAAREPAVGERVMVVGSQLGLEYTVSEGIVSGIRETRRKVTLYQITAAISPGSSGSPVLDGQGTVLGVANGQVPGGQSINFATPASYVAGLEKAPPSGKASGVGEKRDPVRMYEEPDGTLVITDQ
ncbi:MAG: S1C family serine protease [Desulfatibacillaceae bacterium]